MVHVKVIEIKKNYYLLHNSNLCVWQTICEHFQEGDKIPSVDLYEDSPANKINIADLCANKKVALFAVPGKKSNKKIKRSSWWKLLENV